jgi:thioester reductase-like protein
MKVKLIYLLLIICGLTLNAQEITITNATERIAYGINPCYIVTIPNTNIETVAKAWISEMKKAKAKVEGDYKTIATNAFLTDISDNSMDIFANFLQENNDVKMIVGFSLSGIFLAPENNSTAHNAATNFLKQFAEQQYKNQLSKDVSLQKKQIKSTEKEIKKLNKQTDKSTKNIEENKQNIEENKQNIQQNNDELLNKQKILESQDDKLNDLEKTQKQVE